MKNVEAKRIFGFVLKTAGVIAFFGLTSLLVRYMGQDFRTPGLTDEDVKKMDGHNNTHDLETQLVSREGALDDALTVFGLGIQKEAEDHEDWVEVYNAQMKELPKNVRHNHT